MNGPAAKPGMRSDAWARNMRLTAVPVAVAPVYEVLVSAVAGYAGKEQQARELLREYHHPFRNLRFVVEEAWRYATGNLRLLRGFPARGRVLHLVLGIFIEALRSAEDPATRGLAADHATALLLRMCEEMPGDCARPAALSPEALLSDPSLAEGLDQGVLRAAFLGLSRLPAEPFSDLMRSWYSMKAAAPVLLPRLAGAAGELRALLHRLLSETCAFWLGRDDPCAWAERTLAVGAGESPVCAGLAHGALRARLGELEAIEVCEDDSEAVARLSSLADFREIVAAWRALPDALGDTDVAGAGAPPSLLMRLKIMEVKGLEGIHEETLREINRDLSREIRRSTDPGGLLARIFEVLAGCLAAYPEAALQCARTLGLEVLETGDRPLSDQFIRRLVASGFETPDIEGATESWQVRMNPAHVANIRVWLDLIRKNPRVGKPLLSALIVYLSLGGVCIRDTDLFQKEVSLLFHAPVEPVYNLVKQLAQLFPVYFNEIGAEGQLRDVSTDADDLALRRDPLVHFLRKQSHVEGNNLLVPFIEAIFHFWVSGEKAAVAPFVPPEVYAEVPEEGPLVEDMRRIFGALLSAVNRVQDLLDLSEADTKKIVARVEDVTEGERARALLMVRFYRLLDEKYALSYKDLAVHLRRAASGGLPDPSALLSAIATEESIPILSETLDYLEGLKKIVIAPAPLQIVENIYLKRHIAVDIPSMYGSYNERKFDALGLTFRLENLANVLFEELILSFNLSFVTRATFERIEAVLPLFVKALAIDGIRSERLDLQLGLFRKALEVPRFSHSQFMDIFRGMGEAIRQIIHTYYGGQHEENLGVVIERLGGARLLPRYRREGSDETPVEMVHRVSESFLRDLVARTFGLQYLDHFVSSIMTTLAAQKMELSAEGLDLLLSYDPERTLSLLFSPNPATFDLIHLGNKGYNLACLRALGVGVPPGFVVTTEYFRCREVIEGFAQSRHNFRERVLAQMKAIEEATGRRFGVPERPLLVSVRSGAAVSMPGMMNSFLNVGINEAVVSGLIAETGEGWFAWDNYRRFLQAWGMSFGMERDEFDAVMQAWKRRYRCNVKREFTPEQMRGLALAYRRALEGRGIPCSDDPREQLFTAIRQVIASWFSGKARTYRELMGLSEHWGTAVTVQAMVFGNLDARSGAGVMFTHDPWTSDQRVDPRGDFTLGNQGEDVVGGLVKTLPLSEKQRLAENEQAEASLETLFPGVYGRLVEVAELLTSAQHWAPQEIEFTFQGAGGGSLFVLQSRNMTPRVRRRAPVFVPSEALRGACLGSGIGVSGGALCGRVAFSLKAIERLRAEDPLTPVILVRSDTVPDDIREISRADGLLTGKGGATSHAAIVAHRLGKVCVVGFSRMRVFEREGRCEIEGRRLATGDAVGIDGRGGAVYLGCHDTREMDVPPPREP